MKNILLVFAFLFSTTAYSNIDSLNENSIIEISSNQVLNDSLTEIIQSTIEVEKSKKSFKELPKISQKKIEKIQKKISNKIQTENVGEATPNNMSSTMEIIGLIFGIASSVLSLFFPIAALISGVIGIVIACLNLKKTTNKGVAITAIILSILGTILGFIAVLAK